MATTLDTKGLNCPLPVLKTKKAMKDLAAGERITVLATEPVEEIKNTAATTAQGHEEEAEIK